MWEKMIEIEELRRNWHMPKWLQARPESWMINASKFLRWREELEPWAVVMLILGSNSSEHRFVPGYVLAAR